LINTKNAILSNNKTAEIIIKKITYGNPTMKAKFDELLG
jgi:hypothetical protein